MRGADAPRVAVVHDWLDRYAGSERVLERILQLYPDADLFAVVDFVPDDQRAFLSGKRATTTFVQRLPFARTRFRSYLPWMPLAIEQLDLSAYDLVLSSSHAVAKGVITGPNQVHVSYVHSPMRYAWDLQHQYLRESGLDRGLVGAWVRLSLHRLRTWDVRSAHGVDAFLANSHFIAKRIRKTYRRDATVVHPPVDVSAFPLHEAKGSAFVTASRLVPYKRVDVLVRAFAAMPDRTLHVVGDGPDRGKLEASAPPNVVFHGHRDHAALVRALGEARAFLFAAEEDFGITPVEAQATGTPVVAFGRGGALETVRGLDASEPTGVFFDAQTPEAVADAVERFERHAGDFDPHAIHAHARTFRPERFDAAFREAVDDAVRTFPT